MSLDNPDGPRGRGNLYWCIKTDLSKETGEIYAWADEVRIDQGSLVLIYHHTRGERVNLAFAPGSWQGIYSASMMDGSAVAVEKWEGEVVN